jgi:hypothetical protein
MINAKEEMAILLGLRKCPKYKPLISQVLWTKGG